MKIQPSKDVVGISLFLCAIAVGTGILFYLAFRSVLLTSGIILVGLFLTARFFVAFGRTFTLNVEGVSISILGISKNIKWERFERIKVYESSSDLGYKDVACMGVEFLKKAQKRTPHVSPATYCFLFQPYSYIFCTYSNETAQPHGMKYPIFYPIDEEVILAELLSVGIIVQ